MKCYKGFNKDMTCRGFRYEEGKEYTHKGEVKVCDAGFHACEDPLDCFVYYAPGKSVYHEVEQSGDISQGDDDSKTASSIIKIGKRIDIAEIIKAHTKYVLSRTTTEHTDPDKATAGEYGAATAGGYGAATAGGYGAATAGYRGAATAGYCGAATAGYCGAATAGCGGAATAGEYGAATAGYRGAATAGGYGAATAGGYGAATAGEYGAATAGCGGAATAGYGGAATSRGTAAVGDNGIACARGNGCCAKGGLGAVLVLVEENDTNRIKSWKAEVVDGKKIKADTWYKLIDGEFTEAQE